MHSVRYVQVGVPGGCGGGAIEKTEDRQQITE